MTLRLAFMGTPDFAAATLGALIAAGHDIACVYTRAPQRAGRGKKEQKSAVHQMADTLGLPVRTPRSLRGPKAQVAFAELQVDLAVVVAYGLILPIEVLQAPRLGCFNLHGSALPRWRGAAPIQRAIMAGDTQTAVQVMQMDEGLDTGDILLSETLPITVSDTAGTLYDRMMLIGADLMVRAIIAAERGSLVSTVQSADGLTYAHKIDKAEARIDWQHPARQLDWHIRGLSPFPGAWCELNTRKGPLRVKVLLSELASGSGDPGQVLDDQLTVATGEGALRLLQVQAAGGRAQSGADFVRGQHLTTGELLS
ncbi:MAG: methionyl-tRNA formyltransferase [Robiginitomaculum sp.]|nr:MAG: methionyl-tRNA formyltransferase [Robiginitomaculum sp.]